MYLWSKEEGQIHLPVTPPDTDGKSMSLTEAKGVFNRKKSGRERMIINGL